MQFEHRRMVVELFILGSWLYSRKKNSDIFLFSLQMFYSSLLFHRYSHGCSDKLSQSMHVVWNGWKRLSYYSILTACASFWSKPYLNVSICENDPPLSLQVRITDSQKNMYENHRIYCLFFPSVLDSSVCEHEQKMYCLKLTIINRINQKRCTAIQLGDKRHCENNLNSRSTSHGPKVWQFFF